MLPTAPASESKRDLDLTPEEVEKFQKAFKDPSFRELFKEYMDEISDPETRRRHEEEIAQLERERGNSIRWVRPHPQFVLRTRRINTSDPIPQLPRGSTVKVDSNVVYVNIASSPELDPPKSKRVQERSRVGTTWTLPHSLTAPRPDLVEGGDDDGKTCLVFDVVYHPTAFTRAELQPLLISTALDSIAEKFNAKLDSAFERINDFKYKGAPQSTAIREPAPHAPQESKTSKSRSGKSGGGSKSNSGSSGSSGDSNGNSGKKKRGPAASPAWDSTATMLAELERLGSEPVPPPSVVEEPKYTIVHVNPIAVQDFAPDSSRLTGQAPAPSRPQSLLVRIELPRVNDVSKIDVDVQAGSILLNVPTKYHLVAKLPFHVDDDRASAKWSKEKHILELTCPVMD